MIHLLQCRALLGFILFLAPSSSNLKGAEAADAPTPFEGARSSWHDGIDRYDYLMDEKPLEIQPYKRDEKENFGIKDAPEGKRPIAVSRLGFWQDHGDLENGEGLQRDAVIWADPV